MASLVCLPVNHLSGSMSLTENYETMCSKNLNETTCEKAETEPSVAEMTSDLKDMSCEDIQSKVVVEVLSPVSLLNDISHFMDCSTLKPKKSVDFKESTFQHSNDIYKTYAPSEESKFNESPLFENEYNDSSNVSDSFSESKTYIVGYGNSTHYSQVEKSNEKNSSSIQQNLLKENKPNKYSFRLPTQAISVLEGWFMEHKSHPYPSEEEKKELANLTDISLAQVNNWFFNTRRKVKLQNPHFESNGIFKHKSGLESWITLKEVKRKQQNSFKDNPRVSPAYDLQLNSDQSISLNQNHIISQEETTKLSAINHIPFALENASCQVIRILHYILFGKYGKIGNESRLHKTRENILQFSGFQLIDENMYLKKYNSLMLLPTPLLFNIYKILMNAGPTNRIGSVDTLIKFLTKPSDNFSVTRKEEEMKEQEKNDALKKRALEARPIILLEKLNENIFEEMTYKKNLQDLSLSNETDSSEKYVKPLFIQNGNGVPLKQFPEIVINIKKARRRMINVLHSLLYGRPGSEEINRQNILEFNGFVTFSESLVVRKTTYLNRLKSKELWQLCDIFLLRAKSGNKTKKIKKLLFFLEAPGSSMNKKVNLKLTPQQSVIPNEDISKESGDTSKMKDKEISSVKLQDFQSICFNVECATPENLTELYDLLFVKPCDNSDIHQKILDFTSFTFNANSFDYHYRRTLLHYMNFKVVKKIAGLLDIKDWNSFTNQEDLATNILNFLMDMKLPVKEKKSEKELKSQNMRPHILKLQSPKKRTSRSSSPENVDSTYASEEMKLSSEENDCRNEASSYRHRYRKSGLTSKYDQILNDSTPLLEFIQHPTEKELSYLISKILTSTSLSISMGDLVKEVLNCFPNFNLHYRIEFIKTKTLEILEELRISAIENL